MAPDAVFGQRRQEKSKWDDGGLLVDRDKVNGWAWYRSADEELAQG